MVRGIDLKDSMVLTYEIQKEGVKPPFVLGSKIMSNNKEYTCSNIFLEINSLTESVYDSLTGHGVPQQLKRGDPVNKINYMFSHIADEKTDPVEDRFEILDL